MSIQSIILLVFLGGIIATLGAMGYRALLLLRDPFWIKVRRRVWGKEVKEFLPCSSIERALAQAEDRVQSIRRAFGEYNIPLEQSKDESRTLPFEFLETPPGFEGQRPRFLEDLGESNGQMVRIYWQLQSPELLLAERVVDTLIAIRRRDELWSGMTPEEPYPLVRLQRASKLIEQKMKFPWTVVIETRQPSLYVGDLEKLADWLGIGVSFSQPHGLRFAGRCQLGHGMDGIIGGILRCEQTTYGMTCSHVLSAECKSVQIRGGAKPRGNEPDAALIQDTGCFDFPDPTSACECVDNAEVKIFSENKSSVVKRYPASRGNGGFVYSRVVQFPLGKAYYRFPHLMIMPILVPLLGITYRPLTNRAFSEPGESGCWVFERATGRWLGMLVGGDEVFLASFVAEAKPLVNYFKRMLINRGLNPPGIVPIPESYEE